MAVFNVVSVEASITLIAEVGSKIQGQLKGERGLLVLDVSLLVIISVSSIEKCLLA